MNATRLQNYREALAKAQRNAEPRFKPTNMAEETDYLYTQTTAMGYTATQPHKTCLTTEKDGFFFGGTWEP